MRSFAVLVLATLLASSSGMRMQTELEDLRSPGRAEVVGEGPWQGRITEIPSDKLREVMQSDTGFMLRVQKDITQLRAMQRRLPDVFQSKFSMVDQAKDEFVHAAAQTPMTLLGMAGFEGVAKEALHFAKGWEKTQKAIKIGRKLAKMQSSYIKLIISEGRGVPTLYAHDVNLGSLYQSYIQARRAVNMKFHATAQNWYKFKGKRWVPIYKDVENANPDGRVGFMIREEEFIIDKKVSHLVTGINEKGTFTATNPFFAEKFEEAISNAYSEQVTNASMGVFGHLADGRGWVRLDMPSSFGGIADSKPLSEKDKRERCEFMQARLNTVTLPDSDTIEALRSAVSKAQKVTHHIGWDIGNLILSVGLLGTACVFPPAAPAAGVIAASAGLGSSALKVGSQSAFQAYMQPLLAYTMVSLANLEISIFAPHMRPANGSKTCDFNEDWLSEFENTFGVPERVECDIVSNKCGEGEFCMRQGIFINTQGNRLRTGYCMKADWPLCGIGMSCVTDQECDSGFCDLNAEVEASDIEESDSSMFKLLGSDQKAALQKLPPKVQRLMGKCAEPCDLKSKDCERYDWNNQFGIVRASPAEPAEAEVSPAAAAAAAAP